MLKIKETKKKKKIVEYVTGKAQDRKSRSETALVLGGALSMMALL